MPDDPDAFGTIVFAVYLALGLPVAWLHLRQQRMHESLAQAPNAQSRSLVVYTLAVMWPILLFVMALAWLQRKPQSPIKQVTDSGKPCSEKSS